MEKCLIFLSSITSQFRSFFHWIVFNLFFLLRDSENDLLIGKVLEKSQCRFYFSGMTLSPFQPLFLICRLCDRRVSNCYKLSRQLALLLKVQLTMC